MNRAHTSLASLALPVCNLVLLLGLSYTPTVYAQSIEPLFSFACSSNPSVCPNGKSPNTLIQSADGNFYGTTSTSGIGNKAAGTVFKITSGGQLTVLHTFVADQDGNYPNGAIPNSLVEGNDGFLYGTAGGGANGNGVIFKLSRTGTIQILHSFCSPTDCGDGTDPANLVLGADGNFYGNDTESGVLFRITPSGSLTVLHTLVRLIEGPSCLGMMLASDGNLYGTTRGGETLLTTLFRLTPSGQFTTLHTFHYAQFPVSAPVQASNGKLYGAMSRFEEQAAPGIFASNLSGGNFAQFSIPFAFGDVVPYMTPASDSNLWSIIFGSDVSEEVIVLSEAGKHLQTFTFDGANGAGPDAPLLQGSDGRLFGVTQGGGSVPHGDVANGVVFVLNAVLAAPKPTVASFNPSAGKVDSQVMIHGSHFVGTIAVTFGDVSAKFRVLNTGNITATVPAGASTGAIAITNKGGTTLSNNNFDVQ